MQNIECFVPQVTITRRAPKKRAAHALPDLPPQMVELLRTGAAHKLGVICRPYQVEANWRMLRRAERLGYLRFVSLNQPCITVAGRAAIGGPTELEAERARWAELLGSIKKRGPLVPTKRADPRTDFDYRSYRAAGYACTLAVKQPDRREKPATIRVGRSLTSEPQFLGPRNSIVLEESKDPFVLVLMPQWLIKRGGLSTCPMSLDKDDPAWSDEQRALWEYLTNVCFSVNSRIRNAGRAKSGEKMRFGEWA